MPPAFSLSAVRSDDSLSRYLRYVRNVEPLDPETERELHHRYREGDSEAGQQLVLANLRTVVKVAMRYHSRFASMFDLVQEGNVGLMKALNKYEPVREVPFSAYARYWIRAMILRFVMENHRLVKVGRTRGSRRVFFELARETALLEKAGLEPSNEILAQRFGVSRDEMESLRLALATEESLDRPREGALDWHEVLASPQGDPENAAARLEVAERVRMAMEAFIETLDCDRERALVDERLMANEPVSLADLGRRFGVSRERMRQLSKRLQERIRIYLLDELGADIQLAAA